MISENAVAKQKLLPQEYSADSLVAYFSLQELYEVVGANARYFLTAEKDNQDLFYGGENPPYIWWDKFEVKLTNDFVVINKNEGCQVHTDVIKLRMLNSKIRTEFPFEMKTNIELQMNMQSIVMAYTSILSNYRNKVVQRHTNTNNPNKTSRTIQTLSGC